MNWFSKIPNGQSYIWSNINGPIYMVNHINGPIPYILIWKQNKSYVVPCIHCDVEIT